MNEIRLEELAETIFEHMMESFKDLTPSEEQLVYECALDAAVIQKTTWACLFYLPNHTSLLKTVLSGSPLNSMTP